MEISLTTKLQVNSYTSQHFQKTKGTTGYLYVKGILELLIETFKQEGNIPSIPLTKLKDMLKVDCPYITFQKNLTYFTEREAPDLTVPAFLMDTAEKIIEDNKRKMMEELDQ